MLSIRTICLAAVFLPLVNTQGQCDQDSNLTLGAKAESSSVRADYHAANAIDQTISDASRWLSEPSDPTGWLKITFPQNVKIGVVDVFSGYQDGSPIQEFDLSLHIGGHWITPASGKVRGNQELNRRIKINEEDVAAIKLQVVRPSPARIREVAVYETANTPISAGLKRSASLAVAVPRDQHQIAVNQIGYDPVLPMRFTAPLTADGVEFQLVDLSSRQVVYRGKIEDKVGDFSAANTKPGRYAIEINDGTLKAGASDPFLIVPALAQQHHWQSAVDFLIDSRSVLGTHPSAYGGCPWRDGTYYDAILPSLVLFYLSDSEFVDSMPRQIDWNAEKARVLGPSFKFDKKNSCSEGVMDAVKAYFEIAPPKPNAPDIVKLIHWGAGYYVNMPATKDPSGDPLGRKIHSQTLEQLSYVLWAWPVLKKWLPQELHDRCLKLCNEHWKSSGALDVPKLWSVNSYQKTVGGKKVNPMGGKLHPYKGRHAPGHSIVPNLLMYEVANRNKQRNSKQFLRAAVSQAKWIVEKLDWNDPRTTKGHRMSEHRTIPNLVWMLQKYPQHAPRGLKGKVEAWVKVAIGRSDNMWDFRRYDMEEHWTIPKLNDLGNSISLPAIALSASWVVDDAASRDRLLQIASASIDHVFGRNPRLAAAPSVPKMGFPEIERGWPRAHQHNVCARLETVRGSLSAAPGSEMYPFNPEGRFRHAEGWVNYGACWCLTLAYLQFDAERTTADVNGKVSKE